MTIKAEVRVLIYFHGYEVTLILYQRLKFHYVHARIRRGEGAGGPDPAEKSQNIGFLSNTGPDPIIKALRVLMETMSCDFSSCRLSRVHFCRWYFRNI